MMGTLIELQDVWKIYRMGEFDVPALAGVDLAIEANEFVAITGPAVRVSISRIKT